MIRKILMWSAVIVVAGAATWFIFLPLALNAALGRVAHYPSHSLVPYKTVANAVPTPSSTCEVQNFEAIDVKAEARRIEKIASELMPRIKEVETDPSVKAKAMELSSAFSKLRETNVTSSTEACGTPYYFSLQPVVQQMVNDQGFGWFSDFPELTVYWHSNMPDHIYFTTSEKVNDYGVLAEWTDAFGNYNNELGVYIGKWIYIDGQTGSIRYPKP